MWRKSQASVTAVLFVYRKKSAEIPPILTVCPRRSENVLKRSGLDKYGSALLAWNDSHPCARKCCGVVATACSAAMQIEIPDAPTWPMYANINSSIAAT